MHPTDFFLGGIASMGATVFTNPLEVIKTRMQLQGELAAKGTHAIHYKGVLHAFITVAKNDGWSGLQKGLVPALYFQFVLNAFRLGIYSTAVDHSLTKTAKGRESFLKNMFWGAFGGVIGAASASPFFLIKTHLQSQAVASIAVGHQHKHTSMLSALTLIYQKHGIPGLYRGVQSTIPRAVLGSGSQLATFGFCKDWIQQNHIFVDSPIGVSFTAGCLSGTVMSLAITPPDVLATRLYNQGIDAKGKGLYYTGLTDCLVKVFRAEGILGLYKGFWPNYLRIGPHATLVLVFFDQLKLFRDDWPKMRRTS